MKSWIEVYVVVREGTAVYASSDYQDAQERRDIEPNSELYVKEIMIEV